MGFVAHEILVATVAEAEFVPEAGVDGLAEVERDVGFVDAVIAPVEIITTGATVGHQIDLVLESEIIEKLGFGSQTEAAVFIESLIEVITVHITAFNVCGLILEAAFDLEGLDPGVLTVLVESAGLVFEPGAKVTGVGCRSSFGNRASESGHLQPQAQAKGEFGQVVVFHGCRWVCAWHGAFLMRLQGAFRRAFS